MPDRSVEHLLRPRTAGLGLDVFAVEDTAAQLVWSAAPAGSLRVHVAGRQLRLDVGPGPGSLVVSDLRPDQSYRVEVITADGSTTTRRFRTMASPLGAELYRFATISDLHLGRGDRKYAGPLAKPNDRHDGHHWPHDDGTPNPADSGEPDWQFHCARAAIDELVEWGAQRLIVKGDLCDESFPWIWQQAGQLLGDLSVPVSILPGNHDVGTERTIEPELGAQAAGLRLTRGVEHLDVDGMRIVLADSTINDSGWGSLARHGDEVAQLASDADGAVFVATHQHPQRFKIPLFWPHGVPGPDAEEFARTVRAANPATLVSSGHTHRCRVRHVNGLRWSEVAATNHFPGVWAGYVVHERGVRQVVRRIAEPDALGWTEHTRAMLGGVWALWSTGTISDRCFTLDW